MSVVVVVFGVALFFALIGVPPVRRLAFRLGLISMPRADRAHREPTAMMGGVAIYLGATAALFLVSLIASLWLQSWKKLDELSSILAGATVMGAVGLWDDRVRLKPLPKLLAQLVAVALPIINGVYIRLPIPWPLNVVLTFCWVLYVTNGVNFSDNMDGVAGGISAVAAAFFTLIAAMNGQYLVAALAAAVTGACVGFLRYNLPLPRAQIFMGDAGALFLGFLLANLGIKLRFPSNVHIVTWMVPVLVLGVPLFDTTMVFISRFRRGVSLMQGGVDHTSHRLARLGLGNLGATLTLDLLGCAFGMTALLVMQSNILEGYLLGLAVLVACGCLLWNLEWRLHPDLRTGTVNQSTEKKE